MKSWGAPSALMFAAILAAGGLFASPSKTGEDRKSCCASQCPQQDDDAKNSSCCREMPVERQVFNTAAGAPVIAVPLSQAAVPELLETAALAADFFLVSRDVGPHSGLSPPLA